MSISSVSGGSTAWSAIDTTTTAATRGAARRERMFAKADRNGDGSVDSAELQGALDKMAQKSGGTAANADDVMKTMDSDGNGTLSADEFDAGMKNLQPAASSTLDFAQRRGGDEVHGHDGPPPDLQDPGDDGTQNAGTAGAAGSADGLQSLLTHLFQAADTDGNGSLNSSELDSLKTNLDTAIQSLVGIADSGAATSTSTSSSGTASSNNDSSSTDSSGATSTTARDPMATLTALAELVLKEYAATAASSTAAQTSTAGVSLTA